MPSVWPNRLLSGPVTPPAPVGDSNAQSQTMRTTSKASNSLAPPPGPHPSASSSRNHSHNRSSSHPLPRIFVRGPTSFDWDKDSDFDEESDASIPTATLSASPSKKTGVKRPSEDGSFRLSFCMCCGQKSRYPKEHKTFRCTQCLTVNDLVPYRPREPAQETGGEDERAAVTRGVTTDRRMLHPSKVADEMLTIKATLPLSVERTHAIIDFCLTTYLQARLASSAQDQGHVSEDTSYFTHMAGAAPQPSAPARAPGETIPVATPVSGQERAAGAQKDPVASASIKTYADFDWFRYDDLSAQDSKPTVSNVVQPSTQPQVVARKPVPNLPIRAGPSNLSSPPKSHTRTSSRPSIPLRGSSGGQVSTRAERPPEQRVSHERYEKAKKIFRPLEDYMLQNYGRFDCLNISFSNFRPRISARTHSESSVRSPPPEPMDGSGPSAQQDLLPQIDAKTLLLGDFAENGDWWTGRLERKTSERTDRRKDRNHDRRKAVTSKSPCIDWSRLDAWYEVIQRADRTWPERLKRLRVDERGDGRAIDLDPRFRADIELDLSIAREHTERALFKLTEQVLRRPGRMLNNPEDIRFLILILSNPLLYPLHIQQRRYLATKGRIPREHRSAPRRVSNPIRHGREFGEHAGILKRTLGLLAGSSDTCHRHLITWFSRMPEGRYLDMLDLVSGFVSYRLTRRKARPKSGNLIDDGGLIPDITGSAMQTSAQLQTAAGLSGGVKLNDEKQHDNIDYSEDWQMLAAAKVMALMFSANNSWYKSDRAKDVPDDSQDLDARPRSKLHGQLLPISDFYNSMLDYQDVISDFKTWEAKKGKFSFCQYPFFLSMGAKMKILEYDARRQMESKAREVYFNNVISGRAQDTKFHLKVRRDCVVEDSLQRIGEAVGQVQGDLKKGIHVQFAGEEGVDAGGLRKEWFLLLVRDIFDPNHGLFLYDDDSRLCYFNPNTFETSDQYYLVGVLLGLAIYNSTILDVALPPFAFRKLLAAAPSSVGATSLPGAGTRSVMIHTLDDLAELHPSLASGLRKLLEYDGDVESTYLWSFTAPIERYGVVMEVPLVPGGERKPVTNENRHEFVSLYVRYLLDTSVARQFEPFKRGFFTVCAGNALSLFRAEEIELLIRGSEQERIDVDALRAVAIYENFRSPRSPQEVIKTDIEQAVPVVRWFWEFFHDAEPRLQRRLLMFITASDRVPATGAAGLVLRVVAGGDGTGLGPGEYERFPIARTCFNLVTLWGWRTKEELVKKMTGAVEGSEGFGLK